MANEFTNPPPFPGQQIIHAFRLVNDRILSAQDGFSAQLSSLPLDPTMTSLYREIVRINSRDITAGGQVVLDTRTTSPNRGSQRGRKRPHVEDLATVVQPSCYTAIERAGARGAPVKRPHVEDLATVVQPSCYTAIERAGARGAPVKRPHVEDLATVVQSSCCTVVPTAVEQAGARGAPVKLAAVEEATFEEEQAEEVGSEAAKVADHRRGGDVQQKFSKIQEL